VHQRLLRAGRAALKAGLVLLAIGAAGCSAQSGSPSEGPQGQGGSSGSGAGASGGAGPGGSGAGAAGGVGGAGGGTGGTMPYDAGGNAVVTRYSTQIGPFPVEPGNEFTLCSTRRLGNPESVFVGHMAAELRDGSHHMIVYRSTATQEAPDLVPCHPFQGILPDPANPGKVAEAPIMIVQKNLDDLFFPENVGLQIEAGQMIKLEIHYINTTPEPIDVGGMMHFDTVPLTTPNFVASDLAFWGPITLVIPPGPQATPVMFQAGRPGTFGFAATTHQHRLGSRFRIWHSQAQSDPNPALLIDNTDWDEPPLYPINPIIQFNGQNGLSFQCEWNNTTGQLITFGEGALQEMCFLWMYYYPSSGFDIRFF
jgi:hypothetical protein